MMKEITSTKIQKLVGLKANTLHYYVQAGAIIPDIDLGEGTGHTRIFSETNLMEISILTTLVNFGLPKRIILQLFKNIQKAVERDKLNPEKIPEKAETQLLLFFPEGPPVSSKKITHKFIDEGSYVKDMKAYAAPMFICINLTAEAERIKSLLKKGPVENLSS
jgi:DNA-binding transcriptional MerR regulator